MKLEEIGFYTLCDERAKHISFPSPIARAEFLLTDRCNLKCPYCRGLPKYSGDMPLSSAQELLQYCIDNDLQNVRFSGGEPTLYPFLPHLVWACKRGGVKHIAISTNGTAPIKDYKGLIALGVDDFSISLDAGCCAVGEVMSGGVEDAWDKAKEAIRYLSKHAYVTVGVVFNELNYGSCKETIEFIDKLEPSDIRVISSAQYNKALSLLTDISKSILNKYKILNYRISNFKKGRNVRGIGEKDTNQCYLVLDDLAIVKGHHFPCIIYLREGGEPIGKMEEDFRVQRLEWFRTHDSFKDKICKENCLDVCIDFNNKCWEYNK